MGGVQIQADHLGGGLVRRDTNEERARFFTDAASRGVGRALLEDRRAPFEHFFPRNLFLSAVHAVAFTAAPALAAATPGPDAPDDEELLDWEKLAEELKDFKQRAAAMLVRVLGCTSLKRALEAACVKYCALPTADKLVKDASKSALRKAARHGRLGASSRMLATAAYANALSYVSNLAVEEACFFAQYARETKADPRAELAHRRKLKKQSAAALVGYGAAYTFATCVSPAPFFCSTVVDAARAGSAWRSARSSSPAGARSSAAPSGTSSASSSCRTRILIRVDHKVEVYVEAGCPR